LVALDHQQVGGLAALDQVAGGLAGGVQRVAGHHPPGQVHLVQQRLEGRDLPGLGRHPPLREDRAVPVDQRGQQVRPPPVGVQRATQRLAVHRDRCAVTSRQLPSQPGANQRGPSASTSNRCNSRRNAVSLGAW
jgi:hypothetical protein